MDEVGKILPAIFKREVGRHAAPVVEILEPLWHRVVGKNVAEHCRPRVYFAGTLTLVTASPEWAMELRGMVEQLRSKVNTYLGAEVVKRLRVERAKESNRPRPATVPELPPRREPKAADSLAAPASLDPEMPRIVKPSSAKYIAPKNKGVA